MLFGPLAGAAVWLFLQDFLQGPLGLGATWKLVLGLVFVVLVSFLRQGILGGIRDLYRLVRKNEKAPATMRAEAPAPRRAADAMSARPHAGNGFNGPILQAIGLTKHYGGVAANQAIEFSIDSGEATFRSSPLAKSNSASVMISRPSARSKYT